MIAFARVVAVDYKTQTLDLVMTEDSRPVNNVRVMSPTASSNTGFFDVPKPDVLDLNAQFDNGGVPTNAGARVIIAIVVFYTDMPVVIGFLPPNTSQMRLTDEERMMDRHTSDVYQTIDKDGNFEFAHPSGLYMRIGTTTAHEDLSAKSYGVPWKIAKNTDKQVHLHIEQAGGKATLDIAPDGTIVITTATSVSVQSTGDATVTSGGNVTVSASGTATVTAGGKATMAGTGIDLNAGAMKGVVQGDCICAFTGSPHGQVSGTVKASV